MRFVRQSFRAGVLGALGLISIAVPQAAPAQLFLSDPNFQSGPIDGSDPLVGLPLPGANSSEYRSHLLWNLRAGLNVAALQCQFSPYLRAVGNYNGILAHHSAELATAYTTLNNYFKRIHGAQGQKLFDHYSTTTYNNFSTAEAQYGFCQTAADIAREVLSTPKGELYLTAQKRMRELRQSLIPAYDRLALYNPYAVRLQPLPPLQDQCWNKRNQLLARCAVTPAPN